MSLGSFDALAGAAINFREPENLSEAFPAT
jgi:hypothetical protein